MGYIILNGIKSTEKGLLLKSGYNIPIATETIETISVLGRKEGDLTVRTGTYPNLEFTLEFVLKNWKNTSTEMRNLVNFIFADDDNKLFVNNEEYYYEIVNKKIGEINHVGGRGTAIPVTFTTRPFLKLKNDQGITSGTIVNRGVITCEPLIKITGSRNTEVTVTCNGQVFIIKSTASNSFYIDCSRYVVYDSDGTSFKTKGEFPKLEVGNNSFSCNVEYTVYRKELYLI